MPAERQPPSLFRRREFQSPHRRRALLVRLAAPFFGAAVLVGLPTAGALWAFRSPAFGLREVQVSGADRVPAEWVEGALSPLLGRHLLWLELPEAERLVLRHPWIGRVTLRKELPRRLSVHLEERRAAALLRTADALHHVDPEGFVISPLDAAAGAVDLPLLSGVERPREEVPRALALVERWASLAAAWGAGVSEVEVLGADDYRVWAAALPFPVRVSARRLDPGLPRLARLLPAILERQPGIAEIDLRFSRQIVIQPAAPPRSEEG